MTPGEKVRLKTITTDGKTLHSDRSAAEDEFGGLRNELVELQYRLYAEGKQKLLIILQALDAGGKDSTIRKVLLGVNPQGVRVTSFKRPTDEELAHDFLWRIHQHVPASGMIGVFNRSHYEDVLVVRVDDVVPETVWRPRYDRINEFEQLLTESGTTILKFYLHISKKEQKKRLEERLVDPARHWKFEVADLQTRQKWDDYIDAFDEMLGQCTTTHAPWHVIPADQKWYRNLAICRVIVDALKGMDPRFPEADDLSGIEIE
jgi:PPK2 family polyphosphate:nucleotide phosphotransferase